MSGLIDPTTSILSQALDGLTSSQAVISSNLANIDTPGYQPQAVDFQTALQNELDAQNSSSSNYALGPSSGPSADVAMKTTDPRHFSTLGTLGDGTSATVAPTNESIRNDGNKVDLETEMTALSETQIKYEADSRLITGKFAQLYDALGGH
jgi:flagellar basal-body rod protein FlgB